MEWLAVSPGKRDLRMNPMGPGLSYVKLKFVCMGSLPVHWLPTVELAIQT